MDTTEFVIAELRAALSELSSCQIGMQYAPLAGNALRRILGCVERLEAKQAQKAQQTAEDEVSG